MSSNRIDLNSTSNERKCLRLTLHDWFELISNAAIPLMIGVISLWIAIHQESVTQNNREKDSAQAAELRKQDLEIARLQRVEDRKAFDLQREEDQDMSRLQREEDREITQLQRELDWNITNEKRQQDYELAEKERSRSETQRKKEFIKIQANHFNDYIIEDRRQKENVLLEYQDDLADLLLNYGESVKNPESKWWFILQMKTGAVLRQLDPTHRTIIVRTLADAGILDIEARGSKSIFFKGNLSGVTFAHSRETYKDDLLIIYDELHITEADLRYASFYGIGLMEYRFSIRFCNLDYTDWTRASIKSMYFNDEMTMNGAIFAKSQLKGVWFNKSIQMNYVSFRDNTDCTHCVFYKTSLIGAHLEYSKFYISRFESLPMVDSNMTHGLFVHTSFSSILMTRVDMSKANIRDSTFIDVFMFNCSMHGTKFNNVSFAYVNMTGCQGLTDRQIASISKLFRTTLPNGTFIKEISKH